MRAGNLLSTKSTVALSSSAISSALRVVGDLDRLLLLLLHQTQVEAIIAGLRGWGLGLGGGGSCGGISRRESL